jgi:polyisoprenoid-binding protein YceI
MAPLRRPRHWKRWLIGLIVVALVLVVGGPFLYFRVIEGPAPAPLRLPKRHASAGGSATVPVDGRWTVAGTSEAGYRVQEVLFGQSNTAVGRTNAVTGSMTIAQRRVTAAAISVDLTQVSSDQSLRDRQFQGRIMDTAHFPTVAFTLTTPIAIGAVPAVGGTVSEPATGTLAMHGVTRPVVAQVSARRNASTIDVNGSIPVVFADWGIPNPTFGPATTEDHGVIEFLVTFAPA